MEGGDGGLAKEGEVGRGVGGGVVYISHDYDTCPVSTHSLIVCKYVVPMHICEDHHVT